MSTNLALWDSLQTTDPQYTKNFNRGFKGTAINPCWIAKRLTETFGPNGLGWRLVIEDEKYVQGAAIDDRDREVIHVLRGHLEYRESDPAGPKGEWIATSPQFGQTTFIGTDRNGVYTDEEAPKKSATDLLSKCAVMLGLSADIHLGLWDSNKYINEPTGRTAPAKKAADKTPPPPAAPIPSGADAAQTPAALLENFKLEMQQPAYDDLAAWREVCRSYHAAYKRLGLPDDPASKSLVELFNVEKQRLDGVVPSKDAPTEQQASATVPPKRTRQKKIPA